MKQERIAVIGGGSWGTAVGKHLAENIIARKFPDIDRTVKLWVYDEILSNGELLTDTINAVHENAKYLPYIPLPKNLVATPSLEKVIQQSSVLVVVVPDQFLERTLNQIRANIPKGKQRQYKIISLTKGIIAKEDSYYTATDLIAKALNYPKRRIACLSGGNIATEVAQGNFVEAMIGCKNRRRGNFFKRLFASPSFQIFQSRSTRTIELLGALKNVVALSYGFCEGLRLAASTKYAILRKSLQELMYVGRTIEPRFNTKLIFSPAGVSDILVTAETGRNSRFAKKYIQLNRIEKKQSKEYIEQKYFNGQKIQGTHTLGQLHRIITSPKAKMEYTVFKNLYDILYGKALPQSFSERLYKKGVPKGKPKVFK